MKTNLYGNKALNGGSKPSSRSLLAGEQSDTLGLLRLNDRKSRHRRITKQRCYERLAATRLEGKGKGTGKTK